MESFQSKERRTGLSFITVTKLKVLHTFAVTGGKIFLQFVSPILAFADIATGAIS